MHFKVGDQCIAIERAGDLTYISHAHRDHLATGKRILASRETAALLGLNKEKTSESIAAAELHSAGHILGATQLRINDGETIVYTGDFKLRDGFTVKGCEILDCDTLFIDGTFYDPAFIFPDKGTIAEQIVKWTKEKMKEKCVVFGAYAIGKAQELIKLFNENGIVPNLGKKIADICKIYSSFGIHLKYVEDVEGVGGNVEGNGNGDNGNSNLFETGTVHIAPFHEVLRWQGQSTSTATACECALVTGWAAKYKFKIKAFPLSDHAGYNEIVDYIEESGAKRVIFLNRS